MIQSIAVVKTCVVTVSPIALSWGYGILIGDVLESSKQLVQIVCLLVGTVCTVLVARAKIRESVRIRENKTKRSADDSGMTMALAAFCVFLLAGCGTLVPEKRTESVKATEQIANQMAMTVEKISAARPANFSQTPYAFDDRTRMEVSSGQTAGAQEDVDVSVSLPWAISMILGALALVLIAVALFALRRSSATGKAADDGFASAIRGARSLASSVTDGSLKAKLNEFVAEAEGTRARVALRK